MWKKLKNVFWQYKLQIDSSIIILIIYDFLSAKSLSQSSLTQKSISQNQCSKKLLNRSQKNNFNFLCLPKLTPNQVRSNRSNLKNRISISIPKTKSFIFCQEIKSTTKTACSEKQVLEHEKLQINFFTSKNIKLQNEQNQQDQQNFCPMINIIDFNKSISCMKEQTFDSKYELLQKIGEGAHSSVYKCKNIQSEELFAAKITRNIDEQMKNRMLKQYKLLKVLDHQNVLKVQQVFYDQIEQKMYLITELCQYQDLRQQIVRRKQENSKFSVQQTLNITRQILQTVKYLESSGICHRDIKPQNILFNPETMQVKLIDFDVCKDKHQKNKQFFMWTSTGTLHYRAPQTFSLGYNQKVDVWSIGIVIYELLTGDLPFHSNSQKQTIKKIKNQKLEIIELELPVKVKYLLQKMLQKQYKFRLSCSQCLNLLKIQQRVYSKDDSSIKKQTEIQYQQDQSASVCFDSQSIQNICLSYRSKIQFLQWNINGTD